MSEDPRDAAARYRAHRDGEDVPEERSTPSATWRTSEERAAVVETAIQQAMRQGAFDDLPGAGKPLPNLGTHHDPDWWIRQKIQAEDLRGLGPAALTLRVEDRELRERLDALGHERDVREALEDFNTRVRLARMQLQGGPPVVTEVRDVDAELAAWAQRRTAAERPADAPKRPRWRLRRMR